MYSYNFFRSLSSNSFDQRDLSKKALAVYSVSTFGIFQSDGVYFVSDYGQKHMDGSEYSFIGDLAGLNAYLESFAEEDEEDV